LVRRPDDLVDVFFHRKEARIARQIHGQPNPARGSGFSRRELLAGAGIAACGLASGCRGTENVNVPQDPAMTGGPQVAQALQLTDPATNREIEGYASATSVNRGGNISLFVNTAEPTYTIEVLRLGWYGGAGSRSMMQPVLRTGEQQEDPKVVPSLALIECCWKNPYVLSIGSSVDPTDWPSGVYAAKLTAASGKQSYIPFVVRDDSRASDILFQCSVNTYQAYNYWGGRSLYTSPRGYAVSFNRPYVGGFGMGDMLYWEFHMLRYLESQGYDMTYTTNVDTDAQGELLEQHKAFLSVGHDEYWTWEMRNNVEAARARGVNLGFFASNVCYWQIRYAPSPFTGDPARTIVCYKEEGPDPASHSGNDQTRERTTVKFRSHIVGRPEDILIGQMWETWPVQGDMVVGTGGWIFDGAGVKTGDHLPGLLGYEVDRIWTHSPAGTYYVAKSPYKYYGETRYSHMTAYHENSGATVVATGTMQWSWGLSNVLIGGLSYTCEPAQQATKNILERFNALPNSPIAAVSQ
jgi:hypothetical protein